MARRKPSHREGQPQSSRQSLPGSQRHWASRAGSGLHLPARRSAGGAQAGRSPTSPCGTATGPALRSRGPGGRRLQREFLATFRVMLLTEHLPATAAAGTRRSGRLQTLERRELTNASCVCSMMPTPDAQSALQLPDTGEPHPAQGPPTDPPGFAQP